jgi:hypothetical protein
VRLAVRESLALHVRTKYEHLLTKLRPCTTKINQRMC